MEQLKKKQHYVWKEYLRAWCSNGRINAYLKGSKKKIVSNLEGVVQERYYYSLSEFTIEEEMILEEIVKRFTTPDVAEMNMELYHVVVSYSKINRELKKKNIPENFKQELNKNLNLLQKNAVEEIHTRIELLGLNLIKARSIEQLLPIFEEGNRFITFAFICTQYFRTKKMRLAYNGLAKDHPYLREKYSDIIALVFSNSLAWSLAYNNKCRIIYLTNETTIPFITADQPAVNLKQHIKNENGHVGEFELYYPLTPKNAILVKVYQQENSIEDYKVRDEDVTYYNKSIFDNSEEFAFATSDFLFPN